jgi:hypothetical protein
VGRSWNLLRIDADHVEVHEHRQDDGGVWRTARVTRRPRR